MHIGAFSRLADCRSRIFRSAITSPPPDQIPIGRIDPRDGEREVVMARWGLVPFWMKEKPKVPHISARAEAVHKLPLFREAFAKRRCLIPATGFYEWQKREAASSPIASVVKTLNPLPSRECRNLAISAAGRFYLRQ
jgi:putative SOS response-associated peptidase YedK